MRVYRSTYRDRAGRTRESAAWYIEFRDGLERRRRLPAFAEKGASMELGRHLERLASFRAATESIPPDLTRWIETLPPRIQTILVRMGLLEARKLAACMSLTDLLTDFRSALLARGRTERWVDLVGQRVATTFEGCGFATLSDIEAAAVERRLHAVREGRVAPPARRSNRGRPPRASISARESNHRLQACKEFTRWAIERGLVPADPLASLRPVRAKLDPRHVRRALRPEELRALVQAAHDGPEVRGVTGPTRALAWRLGCEAGLRIGEVFTLQVRDIDLEAHGGPTLTIRAPVTKNRTEARLPLHPELARALAPMLRGKLPSASVLGLPPSFRHMAPFWLKRDLEAAGIPYEDESGRKADVHSLRSAFITTLVRSGANVKAVQLLARHSSPIETVGIYTRLNAQDERDAIGAIASVGPTTDDEPMRATGTTGSVLGSCWANMAADTRRGVPLDAASQGVGATVAPSRGGEWRGRRDLNPQPPA